MIMKEVSPSGKMNPDDPVPLQVGSSMMRRWAYSNPDSAANSAEIEPMLLRVTSIVDSTLE